MSYLRFPLHVLGRLGESVIEPIKAMRVTTFCFVGAKNSAGKPAEVSPSPPQAAASELTFILDIEV
jgi:hypothetical protein